MTAAVRQADRSPAQTRAEWRQAADRTLDLAGESDAKVAVHGIRLPVDALLVVRAFELWVHDNDVRRAVGLPPSVPDTPVLRLMSDLAARLLPYAAARTGLREPVDVHLRSEEHTSELQSPCNLVCRLLLEKKKMTQ